MAAAGLENLPSLTADEQKQHRELHDERMRLVGEARAIIDRADDAKRSLTGEEQDTYQNLFSAAEEKRDAQATLEARARLRLLEADRETRGDAFRALSRGRDWNEVGRQAASYAPFRGDRYGDLRNNADEMRKLVSYGTFLMSGYDALSWDQRRDLTLGTGGEGQFTAPAVFINDMIQAVKDSTPAWELVRKFVVNPGFSAQIPQRVSDLSDWTWTGELSAGNEDNTAPFGLRQFGLYDCGGYIEVSNKLLKQSAIDMAAYVAEEMGYKAGVTIEKAILSLSGDGANKPLSLFIAHANGVPTSRDFVGDNTTTAIKGDSLIDAWFGLKSGYQANAVWFFSRTAMAQIQKLKDSTGQYIWTSPARDVSAGFNGTIFGRPVAISEHIPATFTTGLYVGMVANLGRAYYVTWTGTVDISRNPFEKQRENKTVFYGRMELDGGPVLAEAVSRIKLA